MFLLHSAPHVPNAVYSSVQLRTAQGYKSISGITIVYGKSFFLIFKTDHKQIQKCVGAHAFFVDSLAMSWRAEDSFSISLSPFAFALSLSHSIASIGLSQVSPGLRPLGIVLLREAGAAYVMILQWPRHWGNAKAQKSCKLDPGISSDASNLCSTNNAAD